MNYLSHYYFDKGLSSEAVLAGVLPDLLHGLINPPRFRPHACSAVFYEGWGRHRALDKAFHSSPFFQYQAKMLRLSLLPVLENTLLRPTFTAHVLCELILDAILMKNKLVSVEHFYEHLAQADRMELSIFLTNSGLTDLTGFFSRLDHFIEARFLFDYSTSEGVSASIERVGYRLWKTRLPEENSHRLTEVCRWYESTLVAYIRWHVNGR